GPAGARIRSRARTAAGRLAGGTRFALDRDRGRVARLRHSPPARGAQVSELHAYTLLVLVGFLPSEIWRMLGLVAARGIADESELFMWVRAVAIAVLAGVIAKIILFPPGTLASVPAVIRLAAIVCGFAAFLVVRRSVFAGVVAGEVVLTLGALDYGIGPWTSERCARLANSNGAPLVTARLGRAPPFRNRVYDCTGRCAARASNYRSVTGRGRSGSVACSYRAISISGPVVRRRGGTCDIRTCASANRGSSDRSSCCRAAIRAPLSSPGDPS